MGTTKDWKSLPESSSNNISRRSKLQSYFLPNHILSLSCFLILIIVLNKAQRQIKEEIKLHSESSENSSNSNNIEEIYTKINGTGLFDWLVAFPVGLGYWMSLTYLIPFMIKFPTPLCHGINSEGGEYTFSWTREEICSPNYQSFYTYDSSSSSTYNNWITKLGLLCIEDFDLGLFGTFYIAGFVFSALTLLRLGDIFGRKRVLIIGNVVNFTLFILLFFATNVKVIYILLFWSGAIRMLAGSLSYLLMLEWIPENKRSKFMAYVMACEGLSGAIIVGSIYIWRDTFLTIIIMTWFSIIQIVSLAYCPESPKFLYSTNKIREMKKSFTMIAKINGYNPQENDLNIVGAENDSNSNNSSTSLFEAFKDPTYATNITIMWFVYCVSFMSYFVIGYYIGSFKGNLYINAFALIIADVAWNLFSSILYKRFGLKKSFALIFVLITSATIVYLLFSHIPEITYGWVFVMRFGATLSCTLSMYSWSVLFETKIRARSLAFWNFIGRLMTICAPMIVALASNPIIIITTLAISASAISQLLQNPK